VGGKAELTLVEKTNSARLIVLSPDGRELSSRDLGALEIGAHSIEIPGRGLRVVRVRTAADEWSSILPR
jgi:hypothetical protein